MDVVKVEKESNGVVWVTLNRAESRNALSKAVNLRMREVAQELGHDDSVRAIVLTGAGEQAFCAGADLKERKGIDAAESGPFIDAISGAINAWADMPKPTICMLNGSAYGGGLELALACDFRIAANHAKFALTEVRLGIMPGAGGTQRLPRLIGVAKAKEMILLGRAVDAERALQWGLVNEISSLGDLRRVAHEWANELLACAPLSVAKAKEAIDHGLTLPMSDALHLERKLYNVTLFTNDRNEGLNAFAEKRAPKFLGS